MSTRHHASISEFEKWISVIASTRRKRIGLSAKNYGLLVGVSGLTNYNRESGKTKPSATSLAGWAKVRGLGKREAMRRLELIES